jgi:hypothetical protein
VGPPSASQRDKDVKRKKSKEKICVWKTKEKKRKEKKRKERKRNGKKDMKRINQVKDK